MAEHGKAVIREQLLREYLSQLAPIGTIIAEPKDGVVVGHVFEGHGFWTVGENFVVCGKTLFSNLPTAYD